MGTWAWDRGVVGARLAGRRIAASGSNGCTCTAVRRLAVRAVLEHPSREGVGFSRASMRFDGRAGAALNADARLGVGVVSCEGGQPISREGAGQSVLTGGRWTGSGWLGGWSPWVTLCPGFCRSKWLGLPRYSSNGAGHVVCRTRLTSRSRVRGPGFRPGRPAVVAFRMGHVGVFCCVLSRGLPPFDYRRFPHIRLPARPPTRSELPHAPTANATTAGRPGWKPNSRIPTAGGKSGTAPSRPAPFEANLGEPRLPAREHPEPVPEAAQRRRFRQLPHRLDPYPVPNRGAANATHLMQAAARSRTGRRVPRAPHCRTGSTRIRFRTAAPPTQPTSCKQQPKAEPAESSASCPTAAQAQPASPAATPTQRPPEADPGHASTYKLNVARRLASSDSLSAAVNLPSFSASHGRYARCSSSASAQPCSV
ncbi:hypothetical protein APR12_004130 [Nocardia amikacinitolerans]|nr:hypothetical protein [Nocardia amikacinitolerans]